MSVESTVPVIIASTERVPRLRLNGLASDKYLCIDMYISVWIDATNRNGNANPFNCTQSNNAQTQTITAPPFSPYFCP